MKYYKFDRQVLIFVPLGSRLSQRISEYSLVSK